MLPITNRRIVPPGSAPRMKGSQIVSLLILGNAYMATSDALTRGGKVQPSRSLEDMEEAMVPTLGEWERIPDFPPDASDKAIGEAAAAMVDVDLVITGGFETGWRSGAEETYTFDLQAHYQGQTVDWVKKDDNPILPFVSHSGHAVKGGLLYHCGGYKGEDPGPEIDDCYVFDKEKAPGTQWTRIPSLPDARGGGAMVYVESKDWLVFSLGAQRPVPNSHEDTVDFDDTWRLDLSDENADWVALSPIPYKANHVSSVVAKDCFGNPHYIFLGGQLEEREQDGNLDHVYEYFPETNEWQQLAPIPEGTGHVTSSTIAYGCGFLIVGGSIDGHDSSRKIKTDNIYYYHYPTDTWTKVGDYAQKAKTPACAIYEDKLYCASGYRREAYRCDISFPIDLPLIEGAPTSAPVSAPTSSPVAAPLWDDYYIITKDAGGDFCPNGSILVRLEVAGDAPKGVQVTLKSTELCIDMAGVTNTKGKVKFAVGIADPVSFSGNKYVVEGCAYDAGGAAYCDTKKIQVQCPT